MSERKNGRPDDLSTDAIRQCAEWLSYCRKIGWEYDALDRLEEIWWEHHDNRGRYIKRPTT